MNGNYYASGIVWSHPENVIIGLIVCLGSSPDCCHGLMHTCLTSVVFQVTEIK